MDCGTALFSDARHVFRRVAAYDTLKSGLSVSAARRPAPVVPRRRGRGPLTVPTAEPARLGQQEPPGAGELGSPRPRPAPGARAAATSPNSYFCLLFVSLWGPVAGGTRAGIAGPGRDSAPRTRAGGDEPAPGLGRAGLRGRAFPAPAGWSLRLVAHRPLAFLSESFGAGTSPRCAGR